MTQDPLTLYKLIVLYMLNRVTFPLTRNQITDFIQEKEYTNFFTLQQVMAEREDLPMQESPEKAICWSYGWERQEQNPSPGQRS